MLECEIIMHKVKKLVKGDLTNHKKIIIWVLPIMR